MKTKKALKKESISSVKKKVWVLFSKYIRMRDCLKTTGSPDYGECISCGETKPIRLLDAGHFIPKKNSNYFSERGVNAQCQSCNRYHSGRQLDYRRGIIERYGEGVDLELEEEARQIKKFSIKELEELETNLKEKIKLLEVE